MLPGTSIAGYPRRMVNHDERTWERMRDVLIAEANGKDPRAVVSTRTLFGIPSSVERVIDSVAAEEDARCQRIIEQKKQEGRCS